MNSEESKKWSKLIAKAWTDAAFMQRLRTNTEQVLKEHGIKTHPGVTYKVFENTSRQRYIVIPEKPSEEMSDIDLKNAAAGTCGCTCSCGGG